MYNADVFIENSEHNVTQLTLEAAHEQLAAHNLKPENMRFVTVEAMDPELLESCTTTEDESFYNSYMNVIFGKGDRYVLGYRCEDEVIDHAIIKSGDKYYDPTLQIKGDFKPYRYAILTEFKVFDVMRHAKSNKDFPPDVDYLRSKPKQYKNVIITA